MSHTQVLLSRLESIGQGLAASGHGLALLGLGSVGQELARLDDYSDLDFFAIVEPGWKRHFIDHLDWMTAQGSIAWCFLNTGDGYKLMYEDGVFCEFAVFEPAELCAIPFAAGRIVWQRPDFDASICHPAPPQVAQPSTDVQWLVGEALTNIHVGLGRYLRGERLSALQFIQQYAFARLVDLALMREQAQPGFVDVFARERRLEQRYPAFAAELPALLAGYDGIVDSARAMLDHLRRHYAVPHVMDREILALCAAAMTGRGAT